MKNKIIKIISAILLGMILIIIIPSNIDADEDEFLTREELIVSIMKIANGHEIIRNSDIKSDVRYKSYIEGAKLEDIIDKNIDEEKLEENVSREEAFYIVGKTF